MDTSLSSELELSDAIASASVLAIRKLFAEHPGRYYYLSLITTGEALAPVLAAWSEEGLNKQFRTKQTRRTPVGD